jgi:hypothetical protein
MPVISLDELLDIAQDAFDKATRVADTIMPSTFSESNSSAREKSARLGTRLLAPASLDARAARRYRRRKGSPEPGGNLG